MVQHVGTLVKAIHVLNALGESGPVGRCEAVGGDVPVDQIAKIAIPGLEGIRNALVVPGSPDCASLGELGRLRIEFMVLR